MVNTFLRILQELRNNFLKEHLQQATSAIPYQKTIKVTNVKLKPSFVFSVDS